MRIFIEEPNVRLQSHDPEERECFIEESEKLGIIVKENKIKHLDAFGTPAQLFQLLFMLSLEWNIELH